MYGPKKRLGRTPLHFQFSNFAEWTLRFIAASGRCETTVTGTGDSLKDKKNRLVGNIFYWKEHENKFWYCAPIVNGTLLPPSFNSQMLLKYIDSGIKFDNNK